MSGNTSETFEAFFVYPSFHIIILTFLFDPLALGKITENLRDSELTECYSSSDVSLQVELPSQFMENWLYDKTTINLVSGHYRTNETLPGELFQQVCKGTLNTH